MTSNRSKTKKHWFRERTLLDEAVKEDEFILRECAASLMSDTKWRKLVAAVSALDIDAPRCLIKFIGTPAAQPMPTPHERDIRTPSYIDSQFGPFRFKAIEWLEFPRSVVRIRYQGDAGVEVPQDIAAVRMAIEALGQYPIEETEQGFRIVGHILRKDAERIP